MTPRDPFDFSPGSGDGSAPAPPPPHRPSVSDRFRGPDAGPGPGYAPPPFPFPFGDGAGPLAPPSAGVGSRPPVVWLLLSIAVAGVGALWAATAGDRLPVAALAWCLAGPIAIGLVSVYVWRNTLMRSRPYYVTPPWAGVLYGGALVVAAVGIGVSAWRIADSVGRL